MSKRRVHEIAKELKDKHGIEFDNKQVVEELNRLGYDVKTHSSSLEDEEATAGARKIVGGRKPKKAPPAGAPGATGSKATSAKFGMRVIPSFP